MVKSYLGFFCARHSLCEGMDLMMFFHSRQKLTFDSSRYRDIPANQKDVEGGSLEKGSLILVEGGSLKKGW